MVILKLRLRCPLLILFGIFCLPFVQAQDIEKEALNMMMRTAIDKIIALHEKIEGIQEEVEGIKHQVTYIHEIKEEVTTIKEEVTTIKEEVTGINGDNTKIKEEVTGINEEITTIKEEVTGINGDNTKIKEEVTGINEELKAIKEGVTVINEEMSGIKGEIANFTQLNESIASTNTTCAVEVSGIQEEQLPTIECHSLSVYIEGLGCITPLLTRITWDEAKYQCESKGMQLLQDFTKDQMTIINNKFLEVLKERPFPWIGFKDRVWLGSGERITYDIINSGRTLDDGQCGAIDMDKSDYGVNDYSCTDEEPALCQSV